MRPMLEDTSPKERARYFALLRALSLEQKAEIVASLNSAIRTLAETGIRERHPGISDEELRVRLAVRLYGREAGLRLFGRIPDDAQ